MHDFGELRRSDPEWFEFAWEARVVQRWRAGELIQAGAFRRPSVPNGYYYECTGAGQTAGREPAWPRTASATVTDGSVEWTARAVATATVPTVASCTYSIEPAGITEASDEIIAAEQVSRVRLDAGSADLGDYLILATMTDTAGEEHTARARIRVVD